MSCCIKNRHKILNWRFDLKIKEIMFTSLFDLQIRLLVKQNTSSSRIKHVILTSNITDTLPTENSSTI
ncbi:hypothetical protein M2263_001049 [Providencia alcalifaciens]|nr:hypothetical protein [Providencia alcalifaciens]